jgi:hypothetical protein
MGDMEGAFRARPGTRGEWDRYALDQIWQMVRDEDGVANFQQVSAWFKMARLCTDQADQLQKALDQLMVNWPPEPNTAAAAFKHMVDKMIASMRDSAASASANEAPLIAITNLLSDAKDAIGQLRQKQAANEQAERQWMDQASVPFASPSWSPVEPGWRETLDHQARDIMHATDLAVGKAAANFRAPILYSFGGQIDDGDGGEGGGGASEGGAGGGGGGSRPAAVAHTVPAIEFDPPAPGPSVQASNRWPNSDDPVLDGGEVPWSTDPDQRGVKSPIYTSPFVTTQRGVVLAPGGVIAPSTNVPTDGAQTSSVPGALAQRGTTGGAAMIPPPIAGRPTGSARPQSSSISSGGRRRRRSDPDDPWAPARGVPPVLEPSPEPEYFDPGPNVIGIDR